MVAALSLPPEELLVLGGDDRSQPVDGRNSYGYPPVDLDPVVRLSSCTAVPPDAIALAEASRWAASERAYGPSTPSRLHQQVAARIVANLGLTPEWSEQVLLSPSGTEAETLLAAVLAGADQRPVLNVLVGAREAGSGTRLAAAGRRFRFSHSGLPEGLIDGFRPGQVSVVDIDIRDRAGRPRRAFDVEAEIDAHVDEALEMGQRVLVHVIDVSKSGLTQPTLAWVEHRAGQQDVRIVVDAAQGRIPASAVRGYLALGASVLLTGSKALCGPPFSGALLLAVPLFTDLVVLPSLPTGLADTLHQSDLPPAAAHLGREWNDVSYGLLARWQVALHEWDLFLEVDPVRAHAVRMSVLDAVRSVLPPSQVVEGRSLLGLALPTVAEASRVYRAMISEPGVQVGQPVELVAGGTAALRFAVGATTVTRSVDVPAMTDALRSALARAAAASS